MNYSQFKIYLKQIVLYQSRNKKHKEWTIARKCEVNFTTRQLAKLTGKSHVTISKWLKRLVKEGVLRHQRFVNTKEKWKKSMRFYLHLEVLKILRAGAKKRAYRFIKKQVEKSPDKRNAWLTLKEFLFKNSIGKWQVRLRPLVDQRDFVLETKGSEIFFNDLDLRTCNGRRKPVSRERLGNFYEEMMKLLR